MQIADRHGKSMSQVASDYPAWELPYWAVWLARVPDDGKRVEVAVARLACNWSNAHRKKGAPMSKPEDHMLKDYFAEKDAAIIRARSKDDITAMTNVFMQSGLSIVVKNQEEDV